jgi:hypothetical protein
VQGELLVRFPVRACALLITLLLVVSTIGLTGGARAVSSLSQPIEVTDIRVPTEVAQATRGQVSANVTNSVNATLSGFARFTDNESQITCTIFNFTIAYQQHLNVTVDYRVADDAKLGPRSVTFEINVGGFSFLLREYVVEVIPVAAITTLVPGQVFSQGQAGILVAVIQNHADHTKTVRLDTYGPKFINTSQETELAPGINTIALLLQHNASHVYDFGMCPVNLSMYYNDKLIGSAVAVIPVDMTLLNKALGVIVPLLVFECLVLFYAYRKMRRTRAASET